MNPPRPRPHAVPGWAGVVMGVGAVLSSAAMLWAATLPSGNLALTLVAAAGVIAVSLAAVPTGVERVRGRRLPWSILVTVAFVLACVALSVSSTPLRMGASTAAGELETASRSGTCPSIAGVYRVVECSSTDRGTLFFIDGAGSEAPAGFAILHEPTGDSHVEWTGFSVAVWPIHGDVYGFRVDYPSPQPGP